MEEDACRTQPSASQSAPKVAKVATPSTSAAPGNVTKKTSDTTAMANEVISSLLKQNNDEIDHDLAAMGKRIRKHLSEEEQDECLLEMSHIVGRYVR